MDNKKWWQISLDELEHRMSLQRKMRTDPITEMNKEFYRCVDRVLKRLGVDPDSEDYSIDEQCEQLGIIMQGSDDDRAPQIRGIFIFALKKRLSVELQQEPDIIPYAWVSAPKPVGRNGKSKCEIQYFQDNKMDEGNEVKIV